MARSAAVQKNNRRKKVSAKFGRLRAELRAKAIDQKLTEEERVAARKKLQAMPKDTAPERVRTRCELSGRPRGNYKKFGLSRLAFRQLALDGKLPGVTKASW